MPTIWNYRGDHRALWGVIAAIIGSYVLSLRLARWGASWEWILLALPVAVLLIWFFLARTGVRELGFPARADRASTSSGPLGGAAALIGGGLVAAVGSALLISAGAVAASTLLAGPAPTEGSAVSGATGALGAATQWPVGQVIALAAAAAAAQEVVYRGALIRLAQQRWRPATVIGVSGGLSAFGALPILLTGDGSWSHLGASVVALLVTGLALAWAAVRTGALWVPLGWALGLAAVGAAALGGWPTEAAGAWAGAGALALASALLIPLVLGLERLGAGTGSAEHPAP